MTFDEERYARQVLEPARLAGGQPPADLLTRYGLSLPLSARQVTETLPAVLGCWRRARRELKYRKLVARLEADHARLAPAFEKARLGDVGPLQNAIRQARSAGHTRERQLRGVITDIAGPVGRITPELAAELASDHDVPASRVSAVLAEAGVTVTAPDPLPRHPLVGGYPRYREALRTLGCRHTADFVLEQGRDTTAVADVTVWDGLAVLGAPQRRVVRSTVSSVDLAWAARPHDGSRTLASTVLVGLKSLVAEHGPAGIAELVRYEVAEELRVRHRRGASAAALVDYATSRLGLAAEDARRMVFAVRAEPLDRPTSERIPVRSAPPGSPPPEADPAGPPPAARLTAEAAEPAEAPAGGVVEPPRTAISATAQTGTPPGPTGDTPGPTPRGTPTTGSGSATPGSGSATPGQDARLRGPLPPLAAYASLPSPDQVTAVRAGDEVVVRWQWPPELTEVLVRWHVDTDDGTDPPWRERAVSRGAYRDQGGAWLAVVRDGNPASAGARMRIVLVPVAIRHGRRVLGAPLSVRIPARLEAWYEVTRTGPPWRRELVVAVRAPQRTQLRRLMVVLRRGTVMPLHATDGEVLRQLDDVPISPDRPLTLRLSAPRGPFWLRCFTAGDDDVALRDPPVVQLRGR